MNKKIIINLLVLILLVFNSLNITFAIESNNENSNNQSNDLIMTKIELFDSNGKLIAQTSRDINNNRINQNEEIVLNNNETYKIKCTIYNNANNTYNNNNKYNDKIYRTNSENEDYQFKCKLGNFNFVNNIKTMEKEFTINKYESCIFSLIGSIDDINYINIDNTSKNNDTLFINASVEINNTNQNYLVNYNSLEENITINPRASLSKNLIMLGLGIFDKTGNLIDKISRSIENDSSTLENKGIDYYNNDITSIDNDKEYILRTYLYSTTNSYVTGKVKKIVTNDRYSFILLKNNQLYMIDNRGNDNNLVKVNVDNVLDIVVGENHALMLTENGYVYSIGSNSDGQLGDRYISYASTPILVSTTTSIKKIFASGNSSFLLDIQNDCYAFGDNSKGQLGIYESQTKYVNVTKTVSNVKDIFPGEGFTFFLKTNNQIYVIGNNSNMQLGLGNNENKIYLTNFDYSYLLNIKKIVCSKNHTVILLKNGDVYAMGLNNSGQLGNGSFQNKDIPIKMKISGVKDIAVSENHTLLVMENNELYQCGYTPISLSNILNSTKEYPINIPQKVTKVKAVRSISASNNVILVLNENGQVYQYSNSSSRELKINNLSLQQTGEVFSNNIYSTLYEENIQYNNSNGTIQIIDNTKNYIQEVTPKEILSANQIVTIDNKININRSNIEDFFIKSYITESGLQYDENNNIDDDSLAIKLNVKNVNDLILTKLSIYDDNSTNDKSDDILIFSSTRNKDTGEIQHSNTNEVSILNNKTYRIETEVYNSGDRLTYLDLSQISLQFLYDNNNYLNPNNNGTWYTNKNESKIPANSSVKFNWTLFVPGNKQGNLSIHSMINDNHYIVGDNTNMKNDLLTLNIKVNRNNGDINIGQVQLISPQDGSIATNIKMGEEYKLKYTAQYTGPDQYKYVYQGIDETTLSPIYTRQLQNYFIKINGEIQTSVPENNGIAYIKTNIDQFSDNTQSNGINLTNGCMLEFTTAPITFIEAMYKTTANIVVAVNPDSSVIIDDNVDNDTFNKEFKEEYDISVKSFELYPMDETPKNLDEIDVLAIYELEYSVPPNLSRSHLIVSKTKINVKGQEFIFEDPIYLLSGQQKNSVKFYRKLTIDTSSLKPDYINSLYNINYIQLEGEMETNYDRANYEYTSNNQYVINNRKSNNIELNGTKLLKTDYTKTANINTLSRTANGKFINLNNKKLVLAKNNKRYPIYTFSSTTNINNSYNETYRIIKVMFKSKYTEDNYEALGINMDGWMELNNNTKGIVKAGYGYDLKIITAYNNTFNPSTYFGSLGSTIDKLNINSPNEIIAEYNTNNNNIFNNGIYTVSGIKSNKAFDVRTITAGNEIIYEFTTNKKIYTDKSAKDGDTILDIKTPIINGINYGNDIKKIGDYKQYIIQIKGSYLDDVNSHLDL